MIDNNNLRNTLPISNFDEDWTEARTAKSKYQYSIKELTNFMNNRPDRQVSPNGDASEKEQTLKESALSNKLMEILYIKSGEYADINPAPEVYGKILANNKAKSLETYLNTFWKFNNFKYNINNTLFNGLLYPIGILKVSYNYENKTNNSMESRSTKLNFDNIDFPNFYPDLNSYSLESSRYVFEVIETSVKSLWGTYLRGPLLTYLKRNGNLPTDSGSGFDSTETSYLQEDNVYIYNQNITLIFYYYKNMYGKINLEIYIQSSAVPPTNEFGEKIEEKSENKGFKEEGEMSNEELIESIIDIKVPEQRVNPYYLLDKQENYSLKYPYAIFKYMGVPQNFYGVSLGQQLMPMQKQLSKVAAGLNKVISRLGKDVVFYSKGIALDQPEVQTFLKDDDPGTIYVGTDKEPTANALLNSIALQPTGAFNAYPLLSAEMERIQINMERQAGLSEIAMGVSGKSATTGKAIGDMQQQSKIFENKVFTEIENFLSQVYTLILSWIPQLTNHIYQDEKNGPTKLDNNIDPNDYSINLDLLSQSPANKIKETKFAESMIAIIAQHKGLLHANPGDFVDSFSNNKKFIDKVKGNLNNSIQSTNKLTLLENILENTSKEKIKQNEMSTKERMKNNELISKEKLAKETKQTKINKNNTK